MQDKVELTTMVNVLTDLRRQGYKLDFRVTPEGKLSSIDGKVLLTPEQVRIVNFYRFEGESNPDDMAILYVMETDNGLKGTITDAYGLYSDDTIQSFMKQVTDLGKNIDTRS
jgi:hypothetical protein